MHKSTSTGCTKKVLNPRILVANTPMDNDKIKIMGSKVEGRKGRNVVVKPKDEGKVELLQN